MSPLINLKAGFRGLFRRKQVESELSDELQAYLEHAVEQKMRFGMDHEQALRLARAEMGSAAAVKDKIHAVGWESVLEALAQDVRYAFRMLRKSPGFTCVAVITLALGIGANTAIFSVVNGVLLRPLPYPSPERLMSVQDRGSGIGNSVSYLDFDDWHNGNHVFSGMASYHAETFAASVDGTPVRLQGYVVSTRLLSVLQRRPMLGRAFQPEDEAEGAQVVLLNHGFWQQKLHADPSVVGRSLTLDQKTFTVIGVMPPDFQFPPAHPSDLWTSSAIDTGSPKVNRGHRGLSVIARLKSDVTPAQAQADMDLIVARLARQYPDSNAKRTSVRMIPELDRIVGTSRKPLFILLGVVGGVLLIACANLANLSLARNVSRQREIAVRAALGADRRRLVTQLLTESVMLSVLGGICGVLLAVVSTRAVLGTMPGVIPRAGEVGVDGNVLTFALMLSLLTGLLFGLAPALHLSGAGLMTPLKEAAQSASQSPRHRSLRNTLVAAETALALVLLAGAGLLIDSYLRLLRADPGFNPRGVMALDYEVPSPPYTNEQQADFSREFTRNLAAVAGVTSVAAAWPAPFQDSPSSGFEIAGRPLPPGQSAMAGLHLVTPGYFHTLGMRLRSGRDFTDHDGPGSAPVIIVNEALAHEFFPNEDPLGKRLKSSFSMGEAQWREIVGVVNDTKQTGLADDFLPQYFMPYAQMPALQPTVFVKTENNSSAFVSTARSVLASMDKSVPLYSVDDMEMFVSATAATQQFNALLFGAFGILAMILAAVGIYGVVSYTVSQSTREIGIRMALGAQAGNVVSMVVQSGLKRVVLGLGVGLAATLSLTRLLENLLYQVRPTDPVILSIVCGVLIAAALVACYIPARRATKVDPLVVLRYE